MSSVKVYHNELFSISFAYKSPMIDITFLAAYLLNDALGFPGALLIEYF